MRKAMSIPHIRKAPCLLFWCWCFTALWHISSNFGRGQLAYIYCSWASHLDSLPVLSAHSSPVTDNCPSWIRRRERMAVEIISIPNSTKECCRTRDRPGGRASDRATAPGVCFCNNWPAYFKRFLAYVYCHILNLMTSMLSGFVIVTLHFT